MLCRVGRKFFKGWIADACAFAPVLHNSPKFIESGFIQSGGGFRPCETAATGQDVKTSRCLVPMPAFGGTKGAMMAG